MAAHAAIVIITIDTLIEYNKKLFFIPTFSLMYCCPEISLMA